MKQINRLKDLEAINDYYYITTCGKVINTKTGVILKPNINKKGYHQVRLYHDKNICDKKSMRPYIHKLVAMAYIENTDNLDQVDHVDMDKSHNYISNLEWVTNLENMKRRNKIHIEEHGKYGVGAKLSEEDVLYIRANYARWKDGRLWRSNSRDLADMFGVSQKTITSCVNGTHHWYIKSEEK